MISYEYIHTCSLLSRDQTTRDIAMSFGFLCVYLLVYRAQSVTPLLPTAKYNISTTRFGQTTFNLLEQCGAKTAETA